MLPASNGIISLLDKAKALLGAGSEKMVMDTRKQHMPVHAGKYKIKGELP